MPPHTKRQKQVSNLPRKRGQYVSQNGHQFAAGRATDTYDEEYQIVVGIAAGITNSFDERDATEAATNTQEAFEEWDLREFEEVEKRFLSWHNGAGSNLRTVYTGTSRTTLWRQDKEKKKHEEHVKEMKTIDMFFQPVQTILPAQHPRLSSLHTRLEELNQQCSIGKSMKENNKIFTYDYLRLLSIRQFIQLLLDGQSKMNVSRQIAQTIWRKGDYMAMCIRKWGSHFIRTGTLLTHHQGKYTKLESLLDDEDFTENCKAWLRQQEPEVRSPRNLKAYIEDTLFPKSTGHIKKDTISEKTCRNYMHSWGYRYDEKRKGIYYDGHERPDVVAYRKEWLKRMFVYKKSMKDFDGDTLHTIIEPQLEPEKKEFVQVTHDECHFYPNDSQRRIWIQEEENILRSKHLGRSIMVSAFLCPCHGLLRLSEQQLQANSHIEHQESFVLRSIQEDGYWKSEHMLDQVWTFFYLIFQILS